MAAPTMSDAATVAIVTVRLDVRVVAIAHNGIRMSHDGLMNESTHTRPIRWR